MPAAGLSMIVRALERGRVGIHAGSCREVALPRRVRFCYIDVNTYVTHLAQIK
jgi:hypothetical protein